MDTVAVKAYDKGVLVTKMVDKAMADKIDAFYALFGTRPLYWHHYADLADTVVYADLGAGATHRLMISADTARF